jgi:hypothetical protein
MFLMDGYTRLDQGISFRGQNERFTEESRLERKEPSIP